MVFSQATLCLCMHLSYILVVFGVQYLAQGCGPVTHATQHLEAPIYMIMVAFLMILFCCCCCWENESCSNRCWPQTLSVALETANAAYCGFCIRIQNYTQLCVVFLWADRNTICLVSLQTLRILKSPFIFVEPVYMAVINSCTYTVCML